MSKKYFYRNNDYNFTFSEKLSLKTLTSSTGSVENVKYVIEQLKNDYCFKITGTKIKRNSVEVVFPLGYSENKIQWVLEVINYYLPMGIEIEGVTDEF